MWHTLTNTFLLCQQLFNVCLQFWQLWKGVKFLCSQAWVPAGSICTQLSSGPVTLKAFCSRQNFVSCSTKQIINGVFCIMSLVGNFPSYNRQIFQANSLLYLFRLPHKNYFISLTFLSLQQTKANRRIFISNLFDFLEAIPSQIAFMKSLNNFWKIMFSLFTF